MLKNENNNPIIIDLHKTKSIFCFTTINCNLKCPYCSTGLSVDKEIYTNKRISNDLLSFAVIEFLNLNEPNEKNPTILSFSGGEPTYAKGWETLISIMDSVNKKHYSCYVIPKLVTNGVFPDSYNAYLIENSFLLQISFEAFNEKIHNILKPGSYKKAISKIETWKKNDLPVIVRATATNINWNYLNDWLDKCIKLGVTPSVENMHSLTPNVKQLTDLKEIKNINPKKYAAWIYKKEKQYNRILDLAIQYNPVPDWHAPLLIYPDGKIRATSLDPFSDRYVIGEISYNMISIDREKIDLFNKRTQKNFLKCRLCEAYHTCKGKSCFFEFKTTDNFSTSNYWKCISAREYIKLKTFSRIRRRGICGD